MFESGIEGLGRWILREAKHVAASDARQTTGVGDQEQTQRPHAPQDVGVSALAGAAAWRGDGIELKAAGDGDGLLSGLPGRR